MKTLREQIEECKKTGNDFVKEVKTEYYDSDMNMHQARATLEIEPCGDWQISVYDYYDNKKEKWVDTEERCDWTEEVINMDFFEGSEKSLTAAERLADMMNTDPTIPDEAIDEFEKDQKGTIEKYQKKIHHNPYQLAILRRFIQR